MQPLLNDYFIIAHVYSETRSDKRVTYVRLNTHATRNELVQIKPAARPDAHRELENRGLRKMSKRELGRKASTWLHIKAHRCSKICLIR
jgi:hypothetical protein